MTAFRTILFATDQSDRAHAAFPVVRALAGEAPVVVLHVVEQLFFKPVESGPQSEAGFPVFWPADSSTHHQEIEQQLRANYAADGLAHVEYQVRTGEPVEAIVHAAADAGADLIVLATHGRRGLDRVLSGSVAEAVLHRAHCAVLVHHLPDREEFLIRPEPTRLLVHPTDFSPTARAALSVGCSLAHAQGARLLLLHVAPAGASLSGEDESALDALRQQAESAGTKGSVEVRVAYGDPVAEIVRETGGEPSTLLVLGTRGRAGLSRILVGSTAESVLRDAPVPTVLFKPAAPPATA